MAQMAGDGGGRPTPKQRKKIKRSGQGSRDVGKPFEDVRGVSRPAFGGGKGKSMSAVVKKVRMSAPSKKRKMTTQRFVTKKG